MKILVSDVRKAIIQCESYENVDLKIQSMCQIKNLRNEILTGDLSSRAMRIYPYLEVEGINNSNMINMKKMKIANDFFNYWTDEKIEALENMIWSNGRHKQILLKTIRGERMLDSLILNIFESKKESIEKRVVEIRNFKRLKSIFFARLDLFVEDYRPYYLSKFCKNISSATLRRIALRLTKPNVEQILEIMDAMNLVKSSQKKRTKAKGNKHD